MTPLIFINCEVPVFYATTEGQTARIAERIAEVLRVQGLDSRAFDLATANVNGVIWPRVRGVVIGASVHIGRHQRAVNTFLRAHAKELNAIPSAFFSVSLSAASVNEDEVHAAEAIAAALPARYGWKPKTIVSLAGRLAYTQYGTLKKMLMKRIAEKEGGPTNTTRDYELTDWQRVDELAFEMAARIRAARRLAAA
jgi:menaquinone-dependent protoporphyrinogen oxidase